jgi:hypothetical protein
MNEEYEIISVDKPDDSVYFIGSIEDIDEIVTYLYFHQPDNIDVVFNNPGTHQYTEAGYYNLKTANF